MKRSSRCRRGARRRRSAATSSTRGATPCTLTALDGGKAMTEALNQAGIEYVCIGNHEFDFGFDFFASRMKAFKGKAINSNVENAELASLPRYDILAVGDRKVPTIAATPSISSSCFHIRHSRYDVLAVGARKVVVTGLLSEDTSIYAPSSTPSWLIASLTCGSARSGTFHSGR